MTIRIVIPAIAATLLMSTIAAKCGQSLEIKARDVSPSGEYIGQTDVTNIDGSIYLSDNLGVVKFPRSMRASGEIEAGKGSGIDVTGDIKAGSNLVSDFGITASGNVAAGLVISSKLGISSGGNIESGLSITASQSIRADKSIKAGTSIFANGSIIVGVSIRSGSYILSKEDLWAGSDIIALGGITCNNIMAGTTVVSGQFIRSPKRADSPSGICNVEIPGAHCSWGMPPGREEFIRSGLARARDEMLIKGKGISPEQRLQMYETKIYE